MTSSPLLTRPTAPAATPSLGCRRDAFSLPAGTHYLNCAYMAPLSYAVETAGFAALGRQRYPADVPPAEYFDGPDRVRARFARLVNARDPGRVALVPSISYAMAVAVRNLQLSVGQNVVVIGDEFPGAVLAWRRLARDRNVTLRTVAPPRVSAFASRGAEWNAHLYDAIDENTAAVVLAPVHWSDGTRFDVARLAGRAHEVGAMVVVDGTQSIGALPFDVELVRPDLLVTAGYKWLMGGYGVSVAYFGARFDGGAPIEDVWTSQVESDDFARLSVYRDAYRTDASRYDGGQRASFLLVPMLAAALDQLLAWGPERIQRYCAELTAPWMARFAERGVVAEPAESRAAHLFGLRCVDGRDMAALAARLRQTHVHVSIRGDAVRVAPHIYNGDEDLDALWRGL